MTDEEQGFEAHFHFLTPGCLGPYIDKFTAELASAGYTTLSIDNYQQSIAHFGTWLQYKGAGIGDINAEMLATFSDHRCRCPGGRRHKKLSRKYVARVWRFVHYLDQQGLVDVAENKAEDIHPVSVVEFSDWMLRHRGISTRTIDRYARLIISLLPILGNNPMLYDAVGIRHAIESKASRHSRGTVQCFATALRAYLRFLASQGRCRSGLEAAVPTLPQWKLSALPRYLVAGDIERVITAYDADTRCGLRNRAILQLLARLGLRAGDIVNMRLEDVDWDEGTLRVCGKGRREVRLPLPQDVGDALLAYLEQGRPPVAIDQLFLCVPAPYRAFTSSAVVSGIVRNALARAGIANSPSKGANLLRHSAATSMLRAGATLDAISSILRHRSLDMTAHYAKVDMNMLQPITQPWPEEDTPC